MKTAIPAFYFKPTICWVDDDQIFLDAINITFNSANNVTIFNNPNEICSFFNSYQPPISKLFLKKEFTESDIYGTINHFPVDLDVTAISKIETIPNKFNEIAVLIIDYNMPQMNGLELCEKLKNLPLKKILLTGEASVEKAIDAFNSGLIDRYIKKDVNIYEKIQQYIDELIYEFFCKQTNHILTHIESSKKTLLTDPVFINFFNNWCQKSAIEEFYLINKTGSFLVKNRKGEKSYFIVMSENDIQEFIQINDEVFGSSTQLFIDLSNREKIPFFGIGVESWRIDYDDWDKHFYSSTPLLGRERYYWTHVTG